MGEDGYPKANVGKEKRKKERACEVQIHFVCSAQCKVVNHMTFNLFDILSWSFMNDTLLDLPILIRQIQGEGIEFFLQFFATSRLSCTRPAL